ncbi:hypothetical protein [Labilibaculum euxinus]|uniref:hypothetical protein n=1 Tax=Labilibaculum euxinus TaxID=2686357 RepID=UPI0027BAD54E|nr:hypothetical protein [Labilibaculum euxinus]
MPKPIRMMDACKTEDVYLVNRAVLIPNIEKKSPVIRAIAGEKPGIKQSAMPIKNK